jgi:hypothetical protein
MRHEQLLLFAKVRAISTISDEPPVLDGLLYLKKGVMLRLSIRQINSDFDQLCTSI